MPCPEFSVGYLLRKPNTGQAGCGPLVVIIIGVVVIGFLMFLVFLGSFLGVLVALALNYKGRDLVEGSWKVLL